MIMDDQAFLKEAFKLAMTKTEPYNFATVVVMDNQIIATGTEHVFEHNDPTAHDTIVALREAGQKLGVNKLAGCTLYCSDEPCVMCFSAAIWAGIDRIVYGRAKKEDFSYEFLDITLERLSSKVARKPIVVKRVLSDE